MARSLNVHKIINSARTGLKARAVDRSRAKAAETGTLAGRARHWIAGIITGSANNDPAAITAYSIAGASTGYTQLWLMFLATPMLIAVQAMCARIGDVTHRGLGEVIRENFPKPIAYLVITLLIITTTLTIGADLIGIGTAFELVTGLRFLLWVVPVALVIWLLVLFTHFETFTRYLAFIAVVFLGYIVSAILSKPDWGLVLHNLVLPPISLQNGYVISAVAILGATFTPPLFFWQAKEEIEETGTNKIEKAQKQEKLIAPGFIFGQLITMFIMISTAAVLYTHHQTIQLATDAAKALEPLAGPAARYLFAIGIIGSGFMAIPVLASSVGYMVAELFGWRQKLSEKVDAARGFYIVITVALFVGVEIAIAGLNPIQVMYYSQVLAGAVSPFVLLMLLIISNRKKIMGPFTNGLFTNIFGFLGFGVMSISTILLVYSFLGPK